MYSSQDEIKLNSSVVSTLLDKLTELLGRPSIQLRLLPLHPTYLSVYLFLGEDSPSTAEINSSHWQESLLKYLSTAAQQQHHYILKIVSEICRDLEARCNNVERSLREAKEISDDLESKLTRSEATVAKMENQARKRISVFNSLEAKNHRLVEKAAAAEQRLLLLSNAHEKLTYRLECVNREAVMSIESAREKGKQAELAHLAIVTSKDEIYEMQALELAEAKARATNLGDELAQKTAASEEVFGRLEESIYTINKALEISKALADSREIEITSPIELEAKMVVHKQVLELKVRILCPSQYY